METEANKRISAMLCRWAEHAYDVTNVTKVLFYADVHVYSGDTSDVDPYMCVRVYSDEAPQGQNFEEEYTTGLIKNILAFAEEAKP